MVAIFSWTPNPIPHFGNPEQTYDEHRLEIFTEKPEEPRAR